MLGLGELFIDMLLQEGMKRALWERNPAGAAPATLIERNWDEEPAHSMGGESHTELTALNHTELADPGLPVFQPWAFEEEEEEEDAPEDEDFPVPCSFPEALHFMEMSPEEEAQREFEDILSKHVAPEFAEASPVMAMLREKMAAFVPHNWTGISGLEPFAISWKDTVPECMKPRFRPINPKKSCSSRPRRRLGA